MPLIFEPIVSDEHFESAARLFSAFNPSMPTTAKSLKNNVATHPPQFPAHRLLVREGTTVLGYARVVPGFWLAEPNLFSLSFFLDPQAGRWDVLPEVFDAIEALARNDGAKQLQIWVPSHYPKYTEFLKTRNYELEQSNPESMLSLSEFDPTPYQPELVAIQNSEVRIIRLTEFAAERPETWIRDYYTWEMEVMHDVPLAGGFSEIPFDTYEKRLQSEEESPELFFVALIDGEIAASTMLHRNPVDPTIGNTGLTGCRRPFRRRGLARVLKVACFAAAREAGISKIYTDNEENNPMFQLNLDLGFREIYQHQAYGKKA